MIVYIATNQINRKMYIGQTINTLSGRIRSHINSNKDNDTYFHKVLRKCGADSFKWEVLRICNNINELNAFEQYYILYYDSMNNGYNLTSGGLNCRVSEESKQRMRDNHWDNSGENNPNYGKHPSELAKEKNRIAHLGKKHTKESIAKIRDSAKNRKPFTKEHCEKLRIVALNMSENHKEKIRITTLNYWKNIRKYNMEFKIHFIHKGENVVDDVEDYFIVKGDTLKIIRDKANAETKRRNLDMNINNVWSEEINA